ncbi:hypothetical protein GI374_00285 [Paracoccus sp. S-4012]|nr:hypothetical protein [Paracoccus sp. S-4012]
MRRRDCKGRGGRPESRQRGVDGRYPPIAQTRRRPWPEVIPFFAFGSEIRRLIYSTNAAERLDRVICKVIKTRGSFPPQEAAEKLIYLAIREHEKTPRSGGWLTAINQFAIRFDEPFDPLGG